MKPNWFIGLPVQADQWHSKISQNAPDIFRVFDPHDLHLTVAFLGPCGSDAALAGWATLAEKTHPIIHSQLHGLRAMGNPRRPSAFALTLSQGHEETVKLMAHWRGPIYRAANVAPDERPPLPHITVARPPRKASAAIRQMGKDWIQNQPVPTSELKLDGIALYTWSEDRQERLFQIVHQRPLLGK